MGMSRIIVFTTQAINCLLICICDCMLATPERDSFFDLRATALLVAALQPVTSRW